MEKIKKDRRELRAEAREAGRRWAAARAEARERAREIVEAMPLGDKIAQLTLYFPGYTNASDTVDGEMLLRRVGTMIAVTDAETFNNAQKKVMRDNPQHVSLLDGCDFLHGVRTTFPTPLAQSCTWEPEIALRICAATAAEAYDVGCRWTYAPMVDVARDPRWGRIIEGYGEDSLLSSDFSAAAVRGFQGDAPGGRGHVLACLKHFVAYGACTGGRDYNSADIPMQTVFDTYLPPFEAGIEAGASSVMAAYHDLAGVPMSANRFMLRDVLRERLGFDGFVVSDCDSITDLKYHGVAEDDREAVLKGYTAGIDMIMRGDFFNDELPGLVAEGLVSEDDITESAVSVVAAKILSGIYDEPFADGTGEYFFCREHLELCRETGRHAMTLLENNGVLPLTREKAKGRKIAVVGPGATDKYTPVGAWAGCPDFDKTVTVGEGIAEAYAGIADVRVVEGMKHHPGDAAQDIDGAIAAAAEADYVIAVVGEYSSDAGESRCRAKLELADGQTELLERLKALGKPVITLVQTGRPLVLTEAKAASDALMVVWETGSEAGHSVADVLTGDFNPCGRLTTSFPTTTGQVPIYYDHRNTGCPPYTHDGMNSHYYDTPVEPLYCFGHGLGYSKFEYSDAKPSADVMTADGSITVTVNVTNTGEYAGYDVVQLYVHDVSASRARPVKQLADYRKVWVEPGETVAVTLEIEAGVLTFANDALERIVEPGRFLAWVAHDCADEALPLEFYVE